MKFIGDWARRCLNIDGFKSSKEERKEDQQKHFRLNQ